MQTNVFCLFESCVAKKGEEVVIESVAAAATTTTTTTVAAPYEPFIRTLSP